ncbi:hypothetical protein KHM83_10855 [Fusibacter paucivorans]|uniref:Uncharacterized protein n=1 Tax=Fusibacter paucivorans TaxID=76009 RepID=A0ABS5PRZ4_9FIRM|nr:hypothetical protein [Fusibacter paucivorans]MBS7527179.1 hypothetical protein [Fusibacter paucivorans]
MINSFKDAFNFETSKVFCLEDNEIVELEMPILMDLSQLSYGKLKVITKSDYPINQFVNIDVTFLRTRFSLVGKVLEVHETSDHLYEINISLEALPSGMISELKESMAIIRI